MRRRLRRPLAVLAATLATIPSRIVVEVAVVAAFVFILLAIATPADHRNPDASAAHSVVQRLTGGKTQAPACAPDVRGKPQGAIGAPPVYAPETRCRDLQSYV